MASVTYTTACAAHLGVLRQQVVPAVVRRTKQLEGAALLELLKKPLQVTEAAERRAHVGGVVVAAEERLRRRDGWRDGW